MEPSLRAKLKSNMVTRVKIMLNEAYEGKVGNFYIDTSEAPHTHNLRFVT